MEIPGYKILETLGRGGMATVYLAIQQSFERKVAVKVMSPHLAQDPQFGNRFQSEAKIVSQLNHPNIVTVYDVGVIDDHHYLAMEYIPGKELRFRRKELSLKDKIKVIKDIASALDYAGKKGYVHRDVKPENIMLNEEDGRAILMDFGIARAMDTDHHMTKTGTAIGTPYYMSPEQAQGKAVDSRSDLYSLGVVFFQLLAGYVPFDAESSVAIGIKHITEPVPLLPKHLRVFQPVIEKIMSKGADDRYQTGAEIIKAVSKIDISGIVDGSKEDLLVKDLAAKTDPSAPTVIDTATPPPPTLDDLKSRGEGAPAKIKSPKATTETATTDDKKRSPVMLVAGVLVLVAAAGILFLLMGDKGGDSAISQNQNTVITNPTTRLANLQEEARRLQENLGGSASDPDTLARILKNILDLKPGNPQAIKDLTELRDLHLQNIRQYLSDQDLGNARRWLESAERNFSKLTETQTFISLKQQLEGAEQLADVVTQAERYLAADALTTPAGANALELFNQVLKQDKNNKRALEGLARIASRYADLAKGMLAQGKIDEAQEMVNKGLAIDSTNQNLAERQKNIDGAYSNQRAAQKRDDEIQEMLKEAEAYINEGDLVSPRRKNALATYREILEIDATNRAALKGIGTIEDKYLSNIRKLIEKGDLKKADDGLKDATEIFPGSIKISELFRLYEEKESTIRRAQLEASKPRITQMVVHNESFNTMNINNGDKVSLGRTAYFGFSFKNFKGSTSLLQAVLYDGSRTVKIAQTPVVAVGSSGDGYFSISRPVNGYPAGSYNVDILQSDKLIKTMRFTVSN